MMSRGQDFKAKYAVKELLGVLRTNRNKHKATYDKATVNYRKELTEKLAKMLAEARKGKNVDHHIGLSVPVQYTHEYDRAIKMLERTCDESVILDADQFGQLVLDEWNWTHDFNSNTMSYASKKYR